MYLTKDEIARIFKRRALYTRLTRICHAIGMLLVAFLFVAIICVGLIIA